MNNAFFFWWVTMASLLLAKNANSSHPPQHILIYRYTEMPVAVMRTCVSVNENSYFKWINAKFNLHNLITIDFLIVLYIAPPIDHTYNACTWDLNMMRSLKFDTWMLCADLNLTVIFQQGIVGPCSGTLQRHLQVYHLIDKDLHYVFNFYKSSIAELKQVKTRKLQQSLG